MIVNLTINLSAITLQVSSLSYIGLGVQPPTPEWGVLLSEAREFMRTAPHTIIFPGIAILLAALGFNLVGDGLRDALDPRLRD
jgi:peptide/nickel transport system permease protein